MPTVDANARLTRPTLYEYADLLTNLDIILKTVDENGDTFGRETKARQVAQLLYQMRLMENMGLVRTPEMQKLVGDVLADAKELLTIIHKTGSTSGEIAQAYDTWKSVAGPNVDRALNVDNWDEGLGIRDAFEDYLLFEFQRIADVEMTEQAGLFGNSLLVAEKLLEKLNLVYAALTWNPGTRFLATDTQDENTPGKLVDFQQNTTITQTQSLVPDENGLVTMTIATGHTLEKGDTINFVDAASNSYSNVEITDVNNNTITFSSGGATINVNQGTNITAFRDWYIKFIDDDMEQKLLTGISELRSLEEDGLLSAGDDALTSINDILARYDDIASQTPLFGKVTVYNLWSNDGLIDRVEGAIFSVSALNDRTQTLLRRVLFTYETLTKITASVAKKHHTSKMSIAQKTKGN